MVFPYRWHEIKNALPSAVPLRWTRNPIWFAHAFTCPSTCCRARLHTSAVRPSELSSPSAGLSSSKLFGGCSTCDGTLITLGMPSARCGSPRVFFTRESALRLRDGRRRGLWSELSPSCSPLEASPPCRNTPDSNTRKGARMHNRVDHANRELFPLLAVFCILFPNISKPVPGRARPPTTPHILKSLQKPQFFSSVTHRAVCVRVRLRRRRQRQQISLLNRSHCPDSLRCRMR